MMSTELYRGENSRSPLSDDHLMRLPFASYDNTCTFFLSLCSLFIHPFYILILAALLQLVVNVKALYFLPVFCFSLALYWASRNIGIEWDGGADDVTAYIEGFHEMKVETLTGILQKYIEVPAGNEIAYNFLVYCISLFTTNDRVFLFIIYILILVLLAVGSYTVSRRYYLLVITMVFFGIGGFVEQAALHLLRATLASLVLFVAVAKYDRQRKAGLLLLLLASLIHTAAFPLALFFLLIHHFEYFKGLLSLVLLSLVVILTIKYIAGTSLSFIADISREAYIKSDNTVASETKTLLISLILFCLFARRSIDNSMFKYSFFVTSLLFFLYQIMPEYTFIAGRYLYIIQLFSAMLLFSAVINMKFKWFISGLVLFFFVRKMEALSNSQFINGAFNDFLNPLTGPFFILIS